MLPTLIGLSGKLLSGKDTLAAKLVTILHDQHQLAYAIKAFADPLRGCVSGLTGCTIQDLQSQAFKASPSSIRNPAGGLFTYRQLLQRMGDMLRELSPAFLIDALLANLHPGGCYIIADVRKMNEVLAIKARGGVLIRIERAEGASPDRHNTETELDAYTGFDHVIGNDGTLDELDRKVRTWLATLDPGRC
jgi:hypothetical protein